MKELLTIGVLGGMGPQATILLQQRIIDAVNADNDSDHIPLIVDMNPAIPSRLSWFLDSKGLDPAPVLAGMAKRLEIAGAQALAMPCNTAHHFAPAITTAVGIPLLHMVDLAAEAVYDVVSPAQHVGILASPASRETRLFERALSGYDMKALYPANQSAMLATIRRIKAAGPTDEDRTMLAAAARDCEQQGARCLIVGCSEFSLIASSVRQILPVVDTLDTLVEAIVAFSTGTSESANLSQVDQSAIRGF